MQRFGIGVDCHRLVPGRRLVLGGVWIPHSKGLLGHSDGDCLCHAIADALLGAACLPDIGVQFPDTDERYRDASSVKLLETVRELVESAGYAPAFVDAVVVAQEPKLSRYYRQMREAIGKALGLDKSSVSVKATTTEGLGFLGAREGIAALAVATLAEVQKDVSG